MHPGDTSRVISERLTGIFSAFFHFAIGVYSCQCGGGCDRAIVGRGPSIVWGARFQEAGGVFSERGAAGWNRKTEREGPSIASASEREERGQI